MWAYLAYLCGGTPDDDKPNHEIYSLYGLDLMSAEAEAQKIYDNIEQWRKNS